MEVIFFDEKEADLDGEKHRFVSFSALKFSGKIDMERLQAAFDGGFLAGYEIMTHARRMLNKWYLENMHVEDMVTPMPPIEWNYQEAVEAQKPVAELAQIYFARADLERLELLPDAKSARKDGMAKAIEKSASRIHEAVFAVSAWLAESELSASEITRSKVEDFLFGEGYKEKNVADAVWKAIPAKNSGGRPPKK